MNYSSALFTDPAQSLEDAQIAKLDEILDRLDLRSGSRLLEIGCGWGALAERAVERHDVLYTGITLSPAQAEVAAGRLSHRGACRVRRLALTLADLDGNTGPIGADTLSLAVALHTLTDF